MQQVNDSAQTSAKKQQSLERVLIVHPFLKYYGGAEYMLSELLEVFPNADIFTFAYDKKILQKVGALNRKVISPFGNGILSHFYREASAIYPALIETYNFSQYDKIISLSYAYVHGLITSPSQKHISFVLTPMRALWINRPNYWLMNLPFLSNFFNNLLASQRLIDRAAASRPDELIAISREVQKRVHSHWGLESSVIYPPVDIEKFIPKEEVVKKEYYITHSRLVEHKKIDIMIKAFKALKKKLYIVGNGREKSKLKRLAGNSEYIKFLNFVTEEEKISLLQKAKGYIFAAEEDFGISPVEAIAAGTPVLAYKKGGAIETVKENVSGIFFEKQTAESLAAAFEHFEKLIDAKMFHSQKMLESIREFSSDRFHEKIRSLGSKA